MLHFLNRRFGVDFILLARYLKLIPVELIWAYRRSIFNIHPSLLPAFGGKGYYGMKVHKAVIASGARCISLKIIMLSLKKLLCFFLTTYHRIFFYVRFSGPTIHFVDEHYDTWRILAQRVVPVLANDTEEELAARVLREVLAVYNINQLPNKLWHFKPLNKFNPESNLIDIFFVRYIHAPQYLCNKNSNNLAF